MKEFTALRDLWSNEIIYRRARKLQTSVGEKNQSGDVLKIRQRGEDRSERSERETFSEVIMFNVSNGCFLRLFRIRKEILIYAQKNHFLPGLKRDNDAPRLFLMCRPCVSFNPLNPKSDQHRISPYNTNAF